MSIIKRVFLTILIFIIPLFAEKELIPVTLQLQWKHQFQFAGFYMAKERGFYQQLGLDVNIVEYHPNIDVIESVNSGKVEFGVNYSSLVLQNDKDLLFMFAIFQSSPYILLAKKRDDIRSLKDIENKTVMVSNSLADMASIYAMLKAEGITKHNFTTKKTTFDPHELINNKIDFMSSYISNEPFILKEIGVATTIFNPKDYGFDFYGDILFTSSKLAEKNPKLVNDFYKASIRGWEYAFSHIDETVKVIRSKYNTLNKSTNALKYEAKKLKELAYTNGVKFGTIEAFRLKEIANIYRLLGLHSKGDKDLGTMIYKPPSNKQIKLTDEQLRYLKNRKKIKMCIDPNWMPYEKLKDGKHIGMTRDYFKNIEKLVQVPIEVIPTHSWQESLEFGKKRECDIFSLIATTPKREEFLNFTKPYFSFPLMIATTMEKPYINDIKFIKDKKIALVDGYAISELLSKRFPNMKIIKVKDPSEGLRVVAEGKAFGYIDTMPSLNYEIQRKYIGSLKINGTFEEKIKLSIGVRNDDLMLLSILDKAVKSIDKKDIQTIYNRWIQVSYTQEFDLKSILQWFGFIAMILFLVLYKYIIATKHNKKLQESIKSFEMLMESTMESIFIYDEHGICIHANKMASKLFGYRHEELIGKHAMMFISNKSKHIVKHNMKIKNQQPYEAKLIKKDGSEFYALLRGRNIVWNDKKVRVSSIIDISNIKQLQHDLESLNKNLEKKVSSQVEDIRQKDQMLLHQSKLAAMGEMIGAIAHQWRQPLNALNINIQNLDDDFDDGLIDKEFIDNFIEINSKTIQFMSKTIDDFRNFYTIKKIKEHFSVKNAIQETILMQSAQLNHHNIKFSIDGEDFELNSYQSEFKQVILNLVNNAKDAIVEKSIEYGKIKITIQNRSIYIKDNAKGIDEKIIDRIFEPYFTTKEQGKGTGIGLYMSKVIIEENMGGKLSVKNNSNGAIFIIEF
jgi:PAS domain S-box-containing protein